MEREIRDFDKDRGSRIKSAKDKLKKAKADAEAARKALRTAEVAVASAQAEREAAGGETESLKKQMEAAQQAIAGIRTVPQDTFVHSIATSCTCIANAVTLIMGNPLPFCLKREFILYNTAAEGHLPLGGHSSTQPSSLLTAIFGIIIRRTVSS